MNEKPGWEPDHPSDDELFTGRVFERDDTPAIGQAARLWRIFTSPTEVFRDIARKPTWILVLLLTTLVAVGAQLATLPHLDMEATIRAGMGQRSPDMDDEQIEKIAERASSFAWVGAAASVVIVPVIMLAMAGIYLLGLRLAGSETDFAHTFSAVLHAYFPASLTKGVLLVALLQRMGKIPGEAMQNIVKSNPGAFLGAEAPHWQVALGSFFDLFNVWTVVLLVLGLATVGGISRKKAGVVTAVLWGLYLAAKLGLALLKG